MVAPPCAEVVLRRDGADWYLDFLVNGRAAVEHKLGPELAAQLASGPPRVLGLVDVAWNTTKVKL